MEVSACGGGRNAAQFNIEIPRESPAGGERYESGGGVNDGENKVFPIQVSRQELLLFLGAVIVIGTYKNTFYMNAQTVNNVNFTFFGHLLAPDASRRDPYPKAEIEGEENFPIQVHSEMYYFYCGDYLFLFLVPGR